MMGKIFATWFLFLTYRRDNKIMYSSPQHKWTQVGELSLFNPHFKCLLSDHRHHEESQNNTQHAERKQSLKTDVSSIL